MDELPARMNHPIPLAVTIATAPMLLTGVIIFVVGLVVLARHRANRVTIPFLLITTTVSIWLFSVGLMTAVTRESDALVLARLCYLGIPLIPASVFQFTASLVGAQKRLSRQIAAAWSGSLIFLAIFTSSRLMLDGVWHYSWGYYPRLLPLSGVFIAWLALLLGGSLAVLARAGSPSARQRRRDRAFLVALSLGYFGALDYIPAFGAPLYPIGCFAVLGFVLLAVRSIARYELTDLSPSFVADRLMQTMHGGVIAVDAYGVIRLVNPVAARLLGWPVSEMQDADMRELLRVPVLPVTDSDSFCRRSVARDRLVNWRTRVGSEVELSVSASALRDDQGDSIGILYSIADVSDRRRAERNEYGATHDLLTRLPNRTRFWSAVEERKEAIVTARRVPTVLFIDLDGFKAINDVHGHATGDALLQLVAARLRNAIRATDVLARYGGDEFVILLDLAQREDVALVAAKLLRVISEAYTVDSARLTISASIGAAFYPADGKMAEDLVRAADAAMYVAKKGGKARLSVSADPMGELPSTPLEPQRMPSLQRDDIVAPSPFGNDARA